MHPQTKVNPGGTVTVTGTLKNVVPGTPVLSGETVRLLGRSGAFPDRAPTTVATATTNANGAYTLTYKPRETMVYSVASGGITKVENADLDPDFVDLLQPTSTSSWRVAVQGTATLKKVKVRKRTMTFTGTLSPAVVGNRAKLALYAARPGKKLVLKKAKPVAANTSRYTKTFSLPRGKYRVRLTYLNPGSVESDVTPVRSVRLR